MKFIDKISYLLNKVFHSPFKIALVSYYYPGDKENVNNGVGVHVYHLSRELALKGCEVHVFCRGNKDFVREVYLGEGKLIIHRINPSINIDIDDMIVKRRSEYFIFDNRIMNEITKENKKGKINILHTHGWFTGGAFISKYFNNIKWIHTFHSLEVQRMKFLPKEEKKYGNIVRWMEGALSYADAYISVSDYLKGEIIKTFGYNEDKIYKIPNGVDLDIFYPDRLESDYDEVTYVGRFTTDKGVDFVPRIAFKLLKMNEKVKMNVVAPEENILPSLENVKSKFERLEKIYPGRFVWIRNVLSREDLAKLFNRSKILIQPSRYESFGMAVLESMATKCVPVVSSRGGLSEVVQDNDLVLPLNSFKFVKKILFLLKSEEILKAHKNKNLGVAKNFSWKVISNRTLELYKVISKYKDGEIGDGSVLKNMESLD